MVGSARSSGPIAGSGHAGIETQRVCIHTHTHTDQKIDLLLSNHTHATDEQIYELEIFVTV